MHRDEAIGAKPILEEMEREGIKDMMNKRHFCNPQGIDQCKYLADDYCSKYKRRLRESLPGNIVSCLECEEPEYVTRLGNQDRIIKDMKLNLKKKGWWQFWK